MPDQITSSAERLLRLIHWSGAASRQLRRQLAESAGGCGLTENELLVVWLCREGGRVQVDLATAIGVSPAQMSGVVERLGARGLVAMHRPTIDRRRQVWQTSPDGQLLLDSIAPRLELLASALEASLTLGEQETAASLCQQLAEGVSSERRTTSRIASPQKQSEHNAQQEAA